MQYFLALLAVISTPPLGTDMDAVVGMPEGPRLWALNLPEHLEEDPEARILFEFARELIVQRYETYGDLRQKRGLPPRSSKGIPITQEDLERVLVIGRKELKKDEIDFAKLNLALLCLSDRARNGEIVSFFMDVMQAPYAIVKTSVGLDLPSEQVTTMNRTLRLLAQQYTREARAILYECATAFIDPESLPYFRTKGGEALPELRQELISRNAISAYIYFAPERNVLPFVRRVSVAYERAGVELRTLDSAMRRAVEISKGNDVVRQPPPVP